MEERRDSVALDMDIAPWGGQVWRVVTLLFCSLLSRHVVCVFDFWSVRLVFGGGLMR